MKPIIKLSKLEFSSVTIIKDRYMGGYSGGEWLAFALPKEKVPDEPSSDDVSCMNFWDSKSSHLVGRGQCPNEALADLIKLHEE